MPGLSNPAHEARRVAAVRAALVSSKPHERSTGPRTVAGKRRMALNATIHGTSGQAFRLALLYCTAVEAALSRWADAVGG